MRPHAVQSESSDFHRSNPRRSPRRDQTLPATQDLATSSPYNGPVAEDRTSCSPYNPPLRQNMNRSRHGSFGSGEASPLEVNARPIHQVLQRQEPVHLPRVQSALRPSTQHREIPPTSRCQKTDYSLETSCHPANALPGASKLFRVQRHIYPVGHRGQSGACCIC